MNGWEASDYYTHQRIELILQRHGVRSHDEEAERPPRSAHAIAAIISDLRKARGAAQ